MTKDELDKIKIAANAATPGPWEIQAEDCEETIWLDDAHCVPPTVQDLNFIDAARTAVPLLIAEVERLQEIGVAHCLHGHKWVSPPVVCPYCEIASLRKLRDELQAALGEREREGEVTEKLEFTEEDFMLRDPQDQDSDTLITIRHANQRANALLREMLAETPRVYGNPQIPNSWGLSRTGWSDQAMTHQARLVCIEPIGKESGE